MEESQSTRTTMSEKHPNQEGRTHTRREFVAYSAATLAAAGVSGSLFASPGVAAAKSLIAEIPAEGGWVRTTCAPNCTGSCGMKAFVKDGEVKTIVQAADYPYEHYNPRGCLKGISVNMLVHGPDRLKKPLVRNKDTGKMEEVDWDTALSTAGSKLKAVMDKYGPDSVGVIWQVQGTGHIQKGALVRLTNILGWSSIGGYELNGDLPMFWPQTFGCQSEELESYSWEDSRYTMIFGSNVMTTRLPDAHFLTYSREDSGKILYFDPNYTVTAAKSDEWVRIAPGTDDVFALAAAKYIIENNLYDVDFIKTFTDLPILIDTATGKRVLASAVSGLTKPADTPAYREVYVCYDQERAAFVATDPTKLDDTNTFALQGTYPVPMADGSTVTARPAFDLLLDVLKEYTPEYAEKMTGILAKDIIRIAHDCATIKPMHIIYGGSCFQWYHGDLKGRALALLSCLTGNIGRKQGGGISTYVGQYKTRFSTASWFMPPNPKKSSYPFHYMVNGKTKTMSAKAPAAGIKALVIGWGNPFEQHNVANWLREAKDSGELECVISLDFQRTTTSEYSDVVLASASWYEKTELTITPLHPWVQLMQKMVDPPGIAQPELWILKNLSHYIDPANDNLWPEFNQDTAEDAADKILATLLEKGGKTIEHLTPADLRKGPGKLAHSNPEEKHIPFWEQVNQRKPFPTISRPNDLEVTAKFVKSGRIEFYKDEDIFLNLGEQLPIHKPVLEDTEYKADPKAREKYPFLYLTRNSLYRIHATYSNSPFLLELQDNTPCVYLNPDDAQAKGLKEGEIVEVYNSRGKVSGKLVYETGLYPKQCVFEQGWWSRFTAGQSYNTLIWPWINPTNEVYYVGSVWSPNMAWNECACDVRKADAEVVAHFEKQMAAAGRVASAEYGIATSSPGAGTTIASVDGKGA